MTPTAPSSGDFWVERCRACYAGELEDDILMPNDAFERMLREIPHAEGVDLEHTNHYTIVFRPNAKRDQAILRFLDSLVKPKASEKMIS